VTDDFLERLGMYSISFIRRGRKMFVIPQENRDKFPEIRQSLKELNRKMGVYGIYLIGLLGDGGVFEAIYSAKYSLPILKMEKFGLLQKDRKIWSKISQYQKQNIMYS